MPLPFMLYLDTELGVVHTGKDCPGAAIPSKYRYLESIYVTTVEQARAIDAKHRACDRCKKKREEASRSPRRSGWRR